MEYLKVAETILFDYIIVKERANFSEADGKTSEIYESLTFAKFLNKIVYGSKIISSIELDSYYEF